MKYFFFILGLIVSFSVHAIEVKGRLYDLDNNQGVSDAIIIIRSFDNQVKTFSISDTNGVFYIELSDYWLEGEYPVIVTHDNYYTLNGFILIKDGAIRNLYIKRKSDLIVKSDTTTIEEDIREQALAPTANLTFLIDISASMNIDGRIDTLKYALTHLTKLLKPSDYVSIVTYSNYAKLYMKSHDGNHQKEIIEAIDRIRCFGNTNGGLGLDLAFKTAVANFIEGGNNKVILVTDGIFTSTKNRDNKSMEKMIKKMYKKKIALSAFSFGDIPQDAKDNLKKISQLGGGSYAHITSQITAKSVMKEEARKIGNFE